MWPQGGCRRTHADGSGGFPQPPPGFVPVDSHIQCDFCGSGGLSLKKTPGLVLAGLEGGTGGIAVGMLRRCALTQVVILSESGFRADFPPPQYPHQHRPRRHKWDSAPRQTPWH